MYIYDMYPYIHEHTYINSFIHTYISNHVYIQGMHVNVIEAARCESALYTYKSQDMCTCEICIYVHTSIKIYICIYVRI